MFKVYLSLVVICLAMAMCSHAEARDFKKQYACLAKNIYYEAGRESFKGKVAVAQVTINRVKHPGYPNTLCGVVHQNNKNVCQFSWTCENRRQINYKSTAWKESTQAAYKALMGQARVIGHNVLFFHATTVNPMWKYQKEVTIGNHVFYKKGKS